jgi:hypothetical protein
MAPTILKAGWDYSSGSNSSSPLLSIGAHINNRALCMQADSTALAGSTSP